MENKEIEELAIEITRVSLSPLYDDPKVYKDNQFTFTQHRLDIGANKIAEYLINNGYTHKHKNG